MKVAVTGAGGGIGSAVVRRFLDAGCDVLGIDISGEALEQTDGRAKRVVCDLLEDEQLEKLRERLAKEKIDCIVAAHGIDGSAPLEELSEEFYEKVINVNTVATYRLFRAAWPTLKKSKGSFTVVVSQAGLKPEANNVAYCASKYALNGWIRSIAGYAAKTGVAVRGICPGCIGTPLYYAAQKRFAESISMPLEAWLARRDENIPLGRIAKPEEIAVCIWFLAQSKVRRPTLLVPTGGETMI